MIDCLNSNNYKVGPDKIWVLTKDEYEEVKNPLIFNYSNPSIQNLLNSRKDKKQLKIIKLFSSKQDNGILTIDVRKNFLFKISKSFFANFTNITSINLSENYLFKISEGFSKFKNLKTLRLENNLITYIPPFIGRMESLENLCLGSNYINEIPISIQYLTNLKQLKLGKNRINAVPIEFGLLKSLEILHIDSNYFIEIPTTLCYLKNLKEFCFDWLEFTDPSYHRHLKDGIGFTVISFIRKSLQDLLKIGVLNCSFELFIQVNSQNRIDNVLEVKESIPLVINYNEINISNIPIDSEEMVKDIGPSKSISFNKTKKLSGINKRLLDDSLNDNEKTKEYNADYDEELKKIFVNKDFNNYSMIDVINQEPLQDNNLDSNKMENKDVFNNIEKKNQNVQTVKKININKPMFTPDNDKEKISENLRLIKKVNVTTLNINNNNDMIGVNENNSTVKKEYNLEEEFEKIAQKEFDSIVCDDKNIQNKNRNNLRNDLNDKNESKKKKYLRIFYAIENNMYGVIKSFIGIDSEYLKVKNSDGRNPLYYSIHLNKNDLVELILSTQDIANIKNPHIYLHKAIRMRNFFIVKTFLDLGFNPDAVDEQGNNSLHILFNSFTKEFPTCQLIGNKIMNYKIRLNLLNKESWAPVHIAGRRSSFECLSWIIEKNKINLLTGKETFDLSFPGKGLWTPLHLSINCYRFKETLFILNNFGKDFNIMFANKNGKTPKNVSNGNYLMTKLLKIYEIKKYYSIVFNRYVSLIKDCCNEQSIEKNKNNKNINNFIKMKELGITEQLMNSFNCKVISKNDDKSNLKSRSYFISNIQSCPNNNELTNLLIKQNSKNKPTILDLKTKNDNIKNNELNEIFNELKFSNLINQLKKVSEKHEKIDILFKIKMSLNSINYITLKEKEIDKISNGLVTILQDISSDNCFTSFIKDILQIIIIKKLIFLLPHLHNLKNAIKKNLTKKKNEQVNNKINFTNYNSFLNELLNTISILEVFKNLKKTKVSIEIKSLHNSNNNSIHNIENSKITSIDKKTLKDNIDSKLFLGSHNLNSINVNNSLEFKKVKKITMSSFDNENKNHSRKSSDYFKENIKDANDNINENLKNKNYFKVSTPIKSIKAQKPMLKIFNDLEIDETYDEEITE